MTQEEKIKKLEELVFNCQHGDDDEFLDTEYLIELLLDWHTSELNRRMEEVVKELEETKEGEKEAVMQDYFWRGKQKGLDMAIELVKKINNGQ